ncbi:MAG: hypothetical protein ACK4SY_01445 [Pyrobaculum sp.]
MPLHIVAVKRSGVDICEGQILVRCCIDGMCADVPISDGFEPGVYDENTQNPNLKNCLEVLSRQREMGIARLEVCGDKKSQKCPRKLAEYILSKYGGPVLLVGFNREVAEAIFTLTDGFVADVEGRLYPFNFIDMSNPYSWIDKVRSIVVSPGVIHHEEVIELIKKAKGLGKPVVMFGVLSPLYKDLGIEHFCPYGIKIKNN